jgi:hypothetical protein
MEQTISLTRGDEAIDFVVEYQVIEGDCGNHNGSPDTWRPKVGDQIEIVEMYPDEKTCPIFFKLWQYFSNLSQNLPEEISVQLIQPFIEIEKEIADLVVFNQDELIQKSLEYEQERAMETKLSWEL